MPRNREFAAFHVAPADSSDVADEDRVRVEAFYSRYNGVLPLKRVYVPESTLTGQVEG